MGGGYYDRDVTSSDSSSGFDYSSYSDNANKALSQSSLDKALMPKDRILTCFSKNPIVCAIDVTGSMGDWAKIIWDKMPMFYGQIMMQGYLKDPAISFAAIGDATSDQAPMQVCDFAKGSDLDDWITKIWLEGNGGGQSMESYELMAYYYARSCELMDPELGFFFFTADEGFYPKVKKEYIKKWIHQPTEEVDSKIIFTELKKKFNVFLIHKPYSESEDKGILDQWAKAIGKENIIILPEPKAVIDIMLGVIAMFSQARDLDGYLVDMKNRGQDKQRLQLVENALGQLPAASAITKFGSDLPAKTKPVKKRKSGNTKL